MPPDDPNDFFPNILPTQPDSAVAPARKQFKPWHKPRKQFVRRFQWIKEIDALVSETHFPDDSRIFRYLSLPGEDLLDIRSIRDLCQQRSLALRYTGLNNVSQGSVDDVQLNLSENDVKSLTGIHSNSQILRERFEALAETKSVAYGQLQYSGPFNVINVDLCNHVALQRPSGERPTYIDAIGQLVAFQLRYSIQPWLLFLTTRVQSDRVNAENLVALMAAIRSNVEQSSRFRAGMNDILKTTEDRITGVLESSTSLPPGVFKTVFAVGFGKWLLGYLRTAQPQPEVEMLDSFFYSVKGSPDMLSLAYRCRTVIQPPHDPLNLIHTAPHPNPTGEASMALNILERSKSMANVDLALASNPDLREEMIVETEQLLRSAHYPVDDALLGYRAWLKAAKEKNKRFRSHR